MKCFVQCFVEVLGNTKTLTGRFHFRSKTDLCSTQFLKGEYRHLDCNIICLRLQVPARIPSSCDCLTKDHFGCQIYDRNTCYLADIRYGTGRTRVYFNDIYFIIRCAINWILISPYNMQCSCQTFLYILQSSLLHDLADRRCRVYRNTVSGVNTGSLDMFHNTRDQDICTIAYRINLNFFTHKVLINQDRVILCDSG